MIKLFMLNCFNFDNVLVAAFLWVKSLMRFNFDTEKASSLCLNVFRGYIVLPTYLDAFWQMIWGECR